MILLSGYCTDKGLLRTENQDSYGISEETNLFFVCDGMGGGVAGDFASRYARDIILTAYKRLNDAEIIDVVDNYKEFEIDISRAVAAVRLANRGLYNLQIKYPLLAGMGTTFTGVVFEKEKNLLHIYNVGDSRIYRIRNGNIKLLTADHSKIKELIDDGKMTEEESKTAEIQSMITRALGTAPTVKVDYKSEIVKSGDIYVLCSDGLNGELEDYTIRDIVLTHKPNAVSISNELVLAANNSGGRDNTTVITLYAQDEINLTSVKEVYPHEDIVTFESEISRETEKEDVLIQKLEKQTGVDIPKLAKKKNIFTSPFFLSIFLILFGVGIFFLYSHFINIEEKKSIVELTGSISGINIEIKTLADSKIQEIRKIHDRIFRMQVIQESLKDKNFLIPMANVTIMLEKDGQNKFMGLSSAAPLEIKLPNAQYKMTLTYPEYKILDKDFKLKDFIFVNFENSSFLSNLTVIMIPKDIGDIS
ncbi:MAG: protein phosphatase 2C domain-containing protein [Endomicrobiaceae bacterium]|nr:protein phosphatase 2C domain-containing protein [Endomicrobiaceae bacterium]MDD4166695.1 protein phosphatase 2C domain-containing protein [Endomicrobiaceae bacterium]